MASIRNLAVVLCTAASLVVAEDHLVSNRHLTKRFINDAGNYNMSFYHVNDAHAHLDQFQASGTDCTDPSKGCRGGYSRVLSVLKETRAGHPDSLLLNAGDESQGTLYYTYYGGEKIAEALNDMGFDVMTLGNHEWDRGDEHLGDFVSNLTFPIVSANVFSDNEKLNRTIKPYHIFEEFQVAVIGVTTETTPSISKPGNGTRFTNAVQAVQDTVDHIHATTNITRIVALTHIGYKEDIALAQNTTGVSLIVGGHSHTLLGNFTGAEGDYPTIVQNRDGDEVFVVTAFRWNEYLGYIDVTWDAEEKVLEYTGAPIWLSNKTAQDPELQAKIDAWRVPFEEFANEVVGSTTVVLDQTTCQQRECTLGNVLADAMLQYRLNSTTPSDQPLFALTNAGGIRASIPGPGPITRGQVLTTLPFGNAVVDAVLTGSRLWRTIEGVLSDVNQDSGRPIPTFLQVSAGIKIEYNPAATNGSKLVGVEIGGEPVERDSEREYKFVTNDFLAVGGGDNVFYPPLGDVAVLDTLDEVLIRYVGERSPVTAEVEGRIVEVNRTAAGGRGGNGTGTTTGTAAPSVTGNAGSVARVGSVVGLVGLAAAVLAV